MQAVNISGFKKSHRRHETADSTCFNLLKRETKTDTMTKMMIFSFSQKDKLMNLDHIPVWPYDNDHRNGCVENVQ